VHSAAEKSSDRSERGLIDAVAVNLLRLRRNSGIDFAALADLTGLSIEQLAAFESGRAAPNLRALWALAAAFEVPFGVLISGAPCTATDFHVSRVRDSAVVVSAGGGFRSRALSAAGDPREPEVYEVTLTAGWREEAAAHAADTFEHIVVVRGVLAVHVGGSEASLAVGDAVFFRADRPHVYANPGANDTMFHLAMTYAGDWIDDMPP
jgi:transcriptional regulator with XRE-family HTH domain